MKRLFVLLFCSVLLFACSNDVTPSTTSNVEPAVIEEVVEEKPKVEEVKEEPAPEPVKNNDDPWTHIEVDEKVTYKDLDFTVHKVVVSNEIDYYDKKVKAIGTKWKIKNNSSDKRYSTYLGIATLITSDGEQTQVDFLGSDNIGGEIFEGVTKEGNLLFVLERSNVENLEWIKIIWQNTDGSLMNMQETELTINLK